MFDVKKRWLVCLFTVFIADGVMAQKYYRATPSEETPSLSKQAQMLVEAMKQAAGIKPVVVSPYDLLSDDQAVIQHGDKSIEISVSSIADDDFFSEFDDIANADIDSFKKAAFDDSSNVKSAWNKEFKAQQAAWDKENAEFLKRLPIYISNLLPISLFDEVTVELPASDVVPKKPRKTDAGQFHVVKNSLNLPIKNQANRGTCAAFASIRALESIMAQHGVYEDLSEQFFYWLSKPKCQSQPCSNGGSLPQIGFNRGALLPEPVIPLESDCRYNMEPVKANETQIPLSESCTRGFAKPVEFKIIELDQVTASLDLNRPVVIGTKLSPNFHSNRGFVSYADLVKSGKTSKHDGGHAMLLVGYIMLPETIRSTEGDYCMITANSWGADWGRGGYTCISKRWLQEKSMLFMSVNRLETI